MTPARSSWRRAAAIGGVAAVLVTGIGRLAEHARLGASNDVAFRRVERHVQNRFADIATAVQDAARTLAAQPAVVSTIGGNRDTLGRLFDVTTTSITDPRGDLSLTVYDTGATARAWAGRPSEAPRDRILGERAFFVAPGTSGLRLVYVEPVEVPVTPDAAPATTRRLGSVAAEWVLSPATGLTPRGTDAFLFESPIAPVSLRPTYEGGGVQPGPRAFLLRSPTGQVLLEAKVAEADLDGRRTAWRRTVLNVTLAIVALVLVLAALPELARRPRGAVRRDVIGTTLVVLPGLLLACALLWAASTPGLNRWALFSRDAYTSVHVPALLRAPADLLVLGLLVAAFALTVARLVDATRLAWRHTQVARAGSPGFLFVHTGAGTLLALLWAGYHAILADTVNGTGIDMLHTSLQPWDSARLGLHVGLIFLAAGTVWIGVATLLAARAFWRVPDPMRRVVAAVAWSVPGPLLATATAVAAGPYLLLVGGSIAAALAVRRARPWFRHASQAGRMVAVFAALLVPALLAYPSVLHHSVASKRHLVETRYAQQAAGQPAELLANLNRALSQIDEFAARTLLTPNTAPPGGSPDTDRAFLIWRQTDLASLRLTSAVELYGSDRSLVSRFALNFPVYATADQEWEGTGCTWNVFGEAFGSEDRNFLHAERALCASPGDDGAPRDPTALLGALVVHVALDYQALPFISSQSPYVELLRATPTPTEEGRAGQDVELVFYGWGLSPIFSSGPGAWAVDEPLFDRIYASRDPFWTTRASSGRVYDVYFVNNRSGIYALGFPVFTAFDHVVRLVETAVLVGLVFLALLIAMTLAGPITPDRQPIGRALLRELRTSFYRRLFLAFVAVAVIPVIGVALLIRGYFTNQLRSDVEAGAARTAVVAQRVIAELQQAADEPAAVINDDLLVFVSQVIDQDVNIFEGPQLVATSERDLFASGLLPTRTPDAVYSAIALAQLPSFVTEDAIGSLSYLVAAAPIGSAGRDAILTVPLASRQQEIERQIADLDRGILLGVTLLIVLGAAGGFYMAERMADPVKRLTRATQRIARGDFDAQVAARSADELQRLVSAFNRMAEDLKEQRHKLERTHRLEAWAEMARQVAHEIKNPLTPVQLSAEHLLRVHADQGTPLGPVLESCVESILKQVRILRQISAEFSSYASSPPVRRESMTLDVLVDEVLDPYRVGLDDRVRVTVDIPHTLPELTLDRTLVSRALTNVVENSLHAMPGSGSLELQARAVNGEVQLVIRDSGVGLDAATLARIFEPYFSTRVSGTGLGMAIAKRNIELNGGTIVVESRKGEGTTVTLTFPVPDVSATPGEGT